MKKITLLIISILLFNLSPYANASANDLEGKLYALESIEKTKTFAFNEKGITFSVFQNGEFDFYINQSNVINSNVVRGGISISYNSGYNYNAYVQYDDYGAIVQIENVPVYYDYYGRVTRIGGVRLNYFNHRLSRIGGLGIYYNHYGNYSHNTGFINSYNLTYNSYPYQSHFIRPNWNHCVVSYNPYRRYYKPQRYSYYYGKKHGGKHHYNNKKTFRNIESRVGIHGKEAYKNKRSQNRSQDHRLAAVHGSARKQTAVTQRNLGQTQKRNLVKYSGKTVKRSNNLSNHTRPYKARSKRNVQKAYAQSRNVVNKNNLKFKNDIRSRSTQVNPQQKRSSNYSRSTKNKITKPRSSYQASNKNKRSNRTSTKTVAERSDQRKRKTS